MLSTELFVVALRWLQAKNFKARFYSQQTPGPLVFLPQILPFPHWTYENASSAGRKPSVSTIAIPSSLNLAPFALLVVIWPLTLTLSSGTMTALLTWM